MSLRNLLQCIWMKYLQKGVVSAINKSKLNEIKM